MTETHKERERSEGQERTGHNTDVSERSELTRVSPTKEETRRWHWGITPSGIVTRQAQQMR